MLLSKDLELIPQSRPDLNPEDFGYIDEILLTRQISGGPLVERLEKEFSERIGVRDAIASASGTSALHLVLLALGIGDGDEVIIPSYVCTALLDAIHYRGAKPIVAEIHRETLNPTVKEIKPLLGRRSRAIILTHTFGFPADIQGLMDLGIPVIEDCAQSLGARFQNRAVGSFGTIAIFSFYATKMMTSGEGGMILTNHRRLADKIRDLNHPDLRRDYKIRYHYRLSDLGAGLALGQLHRLDQFIARRKAIATRYREALSGFGEIRTQLPLEGSDPSYYRFVVMMRKTKRLMSELLSRGIVCDRPVFRPIHRYLKLDSSRFPSTDKVWKECVSIPIYPSLSSDEEERIVSAMREIGSWLG